MKTSRGALKGWPNIAALVLWAGFWMWVTMLDPGWFPTLTAHPHIYYVLLLGAVCLVSWLGYRILPDRYFYPVRPSYNPKLSPWQAVLLIAVLIGGFACTVELCTVSEKWMSDGKFDLGVPIILALIWFGNGRWFWGRILGIRAVQDQQDNSTVINSKT